MTDRRRLEVTDWAQTIESWEAGFGVRLHPPAPHEALERAIRQLALPDDLAALYRCSNGLSSGWFRVLPIYDGADVRRTWDSLQRANGPRESSFLERDAGLLGRFLVFAGLDAGGCAALDRSDGSLWYEEEGELHQTSFTLPTFIETCLREVRDLSASH